MQNSERAGAHLQAPLIPVQTITKKTQQKAVARAHGRLLLGIVLERGFLEIDQAGPQLRHHVQGVTADTRERRE